MSEALHLILGTTKKKEKKKLKIPNMIPRKNVNGFLGDAFGASDTTTLKTKDELDTPPPLTQALKEAGPQQ
jgi:hypothetical protein